MDALRQDLQYGWRSLRARPAFALVAVATLALGVGANTAIFSAVNALLLRPLPVADADRLVFGMALRQGFDPFGASLLEYARYRADARSLAGSGVGTPRLFDLVESGEPEHLRGAAVTASYLATLGVVPTLGRLFSEDEDRAGGPAVALLGHALWERHFGSDPAAVGRVLTLGTRSCMVVGVMPPGFDMPYAAEVWVPMQVSIDSLPLDLSAATANEFVARLRPGVGLATADAELKSLARRLEQDYPVRRGWSFGIVPLRRQLLADLDGRTHRALVAVVVAVAFLLLICCANVASLLLARGVVREGEMAIRLSLGAGRARLVRHLLAESLLLALAGGGIGVMLAAWLQPLLRALNPIQASGLGVYLTDFRIDGRVLVFSVLLTLLTGGISGVIPALRASRARSPMALLKNDRRASTGAGGRRSLAALVAVEIAVAATLLVGGGLMGRSFQRLQRTELGFRPEGLLTMELPLSPERHAGTAAQARFMEQVLERVRTVPGIQSAGMTTNVPVQRGVTLDSVYEVEGRPRSDPAEVPVTAHRLVSPGYLETLGVTLVEGRSLDAHDGAGAAPVVVVSEELVRQSWPGGHALGKRVRRLRAGQAGPWMTVVGVVRDVKEDRFGFRIDRPVWYVPYAQQALSPPVALPLNLVVRLAGNPASVAAAVRGAVRQVDPRQPVASVMPMEEHLSDVLVGQRFGAVLVGSLATLGLLLAALGLYGVMAYSVGQRTGEIGLRMALGARPRDVLRLVIGQGLVLVAVGLGAGVAGAWTLTRLLSGILYQVSPTDPATFGTVALVLATVALLACWIPARRASRVSPLTALRYE